MFLFVRFRAFGHLLDKLEFIENGDYICILYDVFDVGVYAESSLIEVSHLYIIGISLLPLLNITSRCWIVLVIIYPTSLSLLDSEFFCRSCGSSGFSVSS